MLDTFFYAMYEPQEQEVTALIKRCIGGSYHSKGGFWEMTAVALGMVFCDTGEVCTQEQRLKWPVSSKERNGEKGWGRFGSGQICRLKLRRMKESGSKDPAVRSWCISQVVQAHEDCPALQAVWEEYRRPVVIQDKALGELTLDKDYNVFEGEIQWCGAAVSLSLEVDAQDKASWDSAGCAARKLLAGCETWDKTMRAYAAKKLTGLANHWLSQDEEESRDQETDPVSEEEFARRLSLISLTVSSGGSFTAYFDSDDLFADHSVTVTGSLEEGVQDAFIEG